MKKKEEINLEQYKLYREYYEKYWDLSSESIKWKVCYNFRNIDRILFFVMGLSVSILIFSLFSIW